MTKACAVLTPSLSMSVVTGEFGDYYTVHPLKTEKYRGDWSPRHAWF